MAQVIVNGNSIGGAGNPSKVWWWLSAICLAVFFLMIAIDDSPSAMEQYNECMENADGDWFEESVCDSRDFDDQSMGYAALGGGSCCFSIIFGLIALSVGSSKKKTVIVQQMPYVTQPVIQQVVQQPIQQQPIQQQQGQMPVQQQVQQNRPQARDDKAMWAQKAQNLELARDFEGAAEMYQKAGLYAEAGRVRQSHLEKDDKPMVQIGQVGNSVVKDSVVMGNTNQSTICPNCDASIQPDWKFCPSCNSPL
ncbi:MAG: hypothetical protein CMA81_06260 [Euryarchaeota archaeon]|nr:hypothetical protein [Euryarchaeota archaeon]